MSLDCRDVVQKVTLHLSAHPNASLPIVAERLGIAGQIIEDALHEIEGISFKEFQANKRLERAFHQLGERSTAVDGPYEMTRARRRLAIPKATVKYRTPHFWNRNPSYSSQCPLVDFSSEGLAFLVDEAPQSPKHLSLLMKFPGEEEEVRAEGRVIYTVATGIAGYRYRVGIQFLPFADQKGCNSPKTRETLVRIEKAYSS